WPNVRVSPGCTGVWSSPLVSTATWFQYRIRSAAVAEWCAPWTEARACGWTRLSYCWPRYVCGVSAAAAPADRTAKRAATGPALLWERSVRMGVLSPGLFAYRIVRIAARPARDAAPVAWAT